MKADKAALQETMLRLTTDNGDRVQHLTPAQFFEANAEGLGDDEETAIRSLAVGQSYEGGGGAQPRWTIRRVN